MYSYFFSESSLINYSTPWTVKLIVRKKTDKNFIDFIPNSGLILDSKINSSLLDKDLQKIILSQLNIKSIEIKKGKEISVELDTNLTPELEAEGYAREMSRIIQDFRKKLGLNKKEKVETWIIADEDFKKILEKNKNFIQERTNSEKLEIVTTDKERFKNKIEFRIKDKRGNVSVVKK